MTTKKISILEKAMLITIVLATIMSFSINSRAAVVDPGDTVIPLWENIEEISISLVFSDNVGNSTAIITRIYGVTESLEATLTIYRKEGNYRWVTVASNSGSSTRSLVLDVTFDAIEGATYKAVLDVTAYGINGVETETITQIETN